jgi:hypothetical protein
MRVIQTRESNILVSRIRYAYTGCVLYSHTIPVLSAVYVGIGIQMIKSMDRISPFITGAWKELTLYRYSSNYTCILPQ